MSQTLLIPPREERERENEMEEPKRIRAVLGSFCVGGAQELCRAPEPTESPREGGGSGRPGGSGGGRINVASTRRAQAISDGLRRGGRQDGGTSPPGLAEDGVSIETPSCAGRRRSPVAYRQARATTSLGSMAISGRDPALVSRYSGFRPCGTRGTS